MPIPVKYVCHQCKGETDKPNSRCVACLFQEYVKYSGCKHVPPIYFVKN